MKESIKSIIEWHEQTFGDAETLKGQFAKFLCEKKEWLESNREDIIELADCFIVAVGLGRFSGMLAATCMDETMTQLALSKFDVVDLGEAIDVKMAKNRARKWAAQNGCFQHVEE